MRSTTDLLSEATREGARRAGLSTRELARTSGLSLAQVNRLRGGQVERPTLDTLVKIARALGRNPNLLFIVSGETPEAQARELLGEMFRDGSELIEVWEHLNLDVGATRALLANPETPEFEIRTLALEIFLAPEADENLWKDPYLGSVVEGEDAGPVRELLRHWPTLSPERKSRVMAFVRDQAELSRLEELDELRKEHPGYGTP